MVFISPDHKGPRLFPRGLRGPGRGLVDAPKTSDPILDVKSKPFQPDLMDLFAFGGYARS